LTSEDDLGSSAFESVFNLLDRAVAVYFRDVKQIACGVLRALNMTRGTGIPLMIQVVTEEWRIDITRALLCDTYLSGFAQFHAALYISETAKL
jgi:hypothetical protein